MKKSTTVEEIQLLEDLYRFIIPKYEEAHGIMVSMLDYPHDREIRVADLGCGFGGLTQKIIEAFPVSAIFCLDANLQILQRMREKLSDCSDQLVIFHRNLESDVWTQDMTHLNAVVSSFTLDYLTPERRKQVVAEAFQLLEPAGRWISCEFYRSPDARVNRIFHDLEIRLIQNALKQGEVTAEQIDQLSTSSILRQQHHIITVDEKKQWLAEAGFKQIDVPWRFLNLAVISGVKF
jgi:tRNA (cmo5U34)-methyltransferase